MIFSENDSCITDIHLEYDRDIYSNSKNTYDRLVRGRQKLADVPG